MPKDRNWQYYIEKQPGSNLLIHSISETIYSGKTKFQDVGIIKTPTYGKMLILDGDTQSAELDEFIYHESLVHPALLCHPNPEKILILGGGEGATLREVLKHKSIKEVTMVDIDQEVVQLCEKYLPEWSQGAFRHPKAKLVFQDARRFLAESNQNYDVIISDLTEPFSDSPSYKLCTEEFFKIIKDHLTAEGIFVLQASRGDCDVLKLHSIIYRTLKNVFKIARPFAARIPSFITVWAFIFASEKIDPLKLALHQVDNLINQRIKDKLRFYDGQTHQHIFSLPKYHREALDKQTQILKDRAPIKLTEAGVLPR